MECQRGSVFATIVSLGLLAALPGCGDDGGDPPVTGCDPVLPAFTVGDDTGHPQPFGASATEARAGRVTLGDLPASDPDLLRWQAGDFVLANDRVALVIEDAGDSDLYDPWGGRPVGLARVEDGHMVEPAAFGELFLLTGRASLITESVSVLADGADGGTAIIRTVGTLHPVPFFESITGTVFEGLVGVRAAIDYELAPGSNHVDVRFRYLSDDTAQIETGGLLHALMYTKRTPTFIPGRGFTDDISGAPWIGVVDPAPRSTSWAYVPADQLRTAISESGFVGALATGFRLPACAAFDRVHAQIVIGDGGGVDGVVAAMATLRGESTRQVSGTVRNEVREGESHVHLVAADGTYLTRASYDPATRTYVGHVPADATVTVDVVEDGWRQGTATMAPGAAAFDLTLARALVDGTVHDSEGLAIPARVQILPAPGQPLDAIPASYGETRPVGNRLRVAYVTDAGFRIAVPPGRWEMVVSRGYEYGLWRTTLDVGPGAQQVAPVLEHQVDTTGVQCGDFHIHTSRSNDSGDDGLTKLMSAIADGLELPVRSDHEYVADFSDEIARLHVEPWARGFGSVELTSFEVWGHMGVFPLTPHPEQVNAGAPRWQTFPTADKPDEAFATLSPPVVFDAVRARPEAPVVIINHPRGNTNYFGYVGYDPATGMASSVADWDTTFTLVEVFNDSSWTQARTGIVEDWLGLLKAGRKIFAVGSSDSHGITTSPVGYPRTCLALGTDDPRQLTAVQVRDTLAAGHGTISGGIYVSARVGAANPGDTVTGLGDSASVEVTVQAADWIDVDALDIVVDGVTVDTIAISPGDADPENPAIRFHRTLPIDVRADGSGFVIVAAYGNAALEPVHPGRLPFGVTNPIFVKP